jgi:hypothetical protein
MQGQVAGLKSSERRIGSALIYTTSMRNCKSLQSMICRNSPVNYVRKLHIAAGAPCCGCVPAQSELPDKG